MDTNRQVGVLLDVEIKPVDTIKALVDIRKEVVELRQKQKELDRTTAEGAIEYEKLSAQIKLGTKTIREYEKEVTNTITQEKAQEGSIKALRAELTNTKDAYVALSKTEREGAKGKELLNKTASLNAELKDLESAYGDNQRKVGEYENAGKSLRSEIRDLTQELATMQLTNRDNSEEYQTMVTRLAELKDAMADVSAQTNQMASDTAAFDTMLQGAQAVTASYNVWKSTTTLLGIENEALDATVQKLVIAMSALQALTTLQTLAQKQSNIYRTVGNVLQKLKIKQTTAETLTTSANVAAITAEAVAENASTAAKVKGVVVTKAVTAAQWLWNAAMSANPLVALVVVAMAAIAAISGIVGAMNKDSEATKESNRAHERLNITLKEGADLRAKIDNEGAEALNKRMLAGRKEIHQMQKNGATEADILRAQSEIDRETTYLKLKHSHSRVEQSKYELAAVEETIKKQEAELRTVDFTKDRYKELTAQIDTNIEARNKLNSSIISDNALILNLDQDSIEREYNLQKSLKDTAKTAADAAKSRVDAAISAYEKDLDAQKKFTEAALKAEAGYQSDDFAARQTYARRIFDLNQQTEQAKLANLRKYKRITEAEYAQSLGVLDAQLREFSNGQVKALNKYFDDERKVILGMLSRTLDEEIATVEKKYTDAVKRLESIKPPSMLPGEDSAVYAARLAEYEAFAFEQASIVIRLEAERNRELDRARASHLAKQIKDIEDASKKAYESDIARYQANERKKIETTEKMLLDQIAAKKAAGIETYNDEAQLEQLAQQRIALNLNRDLISARDSAKKKYDAKVKALNEEQVLYAGNADKLLEIEQKTVDAEKVLWDERATALAEWGAMASEVLNGINGLMSAGLDAQLQKVQETYDRESLVLADKYALGLLTEAEYNKETLKLGQQKEKEEAKIAHKKAIRERVGKVFSVVTDTAVGAMKSVAASPLTGGMPWTAIVAAMGALNLATILAEPLPKAARGGLINGPSHRAGGTIIEAEGGEAIMSRRTVSMFGPILSALNELGGGVPFAGALSDGGYTLRSASSPRSASADEMADAMKHVKIYTTVEDINRGQGKYAEIQSRGTIIGD